MFSCCSSERKEDEAKTFFRSEGSLVFSLRLFHPKVFSKVRPLKERSTNRTKINYYRSPELYNNYKDGKRIREEGTEKCNMRHP